MNFVDDAEEGSQHPYPTTQQYQTTAQDTMDVDDFEYDNDDDDTKDGADQAYYRTMSSASQGAWWPVAKGRPLAHGDPQCNVTSHTEGGDVLISFHGPELCPRDPEPGLDIMFVLDRSGSTELLASTGAEHDGCTVLDLMIHAVGVLVESMSNNDCIGLITYSSGYDLCFPRSPASPGTIATFKRRMNEVRSGGCTETWKAAAAAVDNMSRFAGIMPRTRTARAVFIFTDGVSDDMPTQEAAFQQLASQGVPVTTFAFSSPNYKGHSDAVALNRLSQLTGGSFVHIYSRQMMVTSLANALANARFQVGAPIVRVRSSVRNAILTVDGSPSAGEVNLTAPRAQYGGIRHVLVRGCGANPAVTVVGAGEVTPQAVKGDVYREEVQRSEFVSLLRQGLKKLVYANFVFTEASSKSAMQVIRGGVNRVVGIARDSLLAKDILDEVRQAVKTSAIFDRWGRDFLFAFLCAHDHQERPNFKGVSTARYATAHVLGIVEKIDRLHANAGVPRRTRKAEARVEVDTSNDNDVGSGCVSGDSLVHMGDGSVRACRELRPGDVVATGDGVHDIVQLVLAFPRRGPISLTHVSSGLALTPWHPVLVDHQWRFPGEAFPGCTRMHSQGVDIYSVVLKNRSSSLLVGGVPVITLASAVAGDPVASHPFFGSESVVKAAESLLLNSDGHREAEGCVRSPSSGLVCGLY